MRSALLIATVVLTVPSLPRQAAAQKRCFCFDWVHHEQFGKECHASMDTCKEAHKRWARSGDRTECKESKDGKCDTWGCESPGGDCHRYGCPVDAGQPPSSASTPPAAPPAPPAAPPGAPASPRRTLRLAGSVSAIEPSSLPHSTKNWAVTLKVDEVLAGTFAGDTFTFRVHSPAKSRLAVGQHIELVAQATESGYVVDDLQWLTSGKNEKPAKKAKP
jgi:hypothetical protein